MSRPDPIRCNAIHSNAIHSNVIHGNAIHGHVARPDPIHPCDQHPGLERAAPAGGLAAAVASDTGLDLARLLIRDPRRTLLLRVCGDSMLGAGIRHGDLLVVERRRQARTGSIVVARLGGRFTLKRLRRRGTRCWLEAAHPAYPPIELEATARQQGLTEAEVELWGVAVHVIHTF